MEQTDVFGKGAVTGIDAHGIAQAETVRADVVVPVGAVPAGSTVDGGIAAHMLSDMKCGDAGADLFHDAGGFMAQNQGGLKTVGGRFVGAEIGAADGGILELEAYLALLGFRRGPFLQYQFSGSVVDQCFHM